MNDQLLSHLETFDSDEDFSVSSDVLVEEDADMTLHHMMDTNGFWVLGKIGQIFDPSLALGSLIQNLVQVGWLLPIGITLSDYVGPFMSWNLALIFFILKCQPRLPDESNKDDARGDSSREDGYRNDSVTMRRLQDCRSEMSKLLGLVGAPPLKWQDFQALNDSNEELNEDVEISSEATIAVLQLLEAHVQFLLAVDEAFRWLQTSSSLHLGLGPQSQSVERVERASIAREFRNKKLQGDSKVSSTESGVDGKQLEPLRRQSRSSILSLSFVRSHLAKALVDQSDSLVHIWYDVQESAGIEDIPTSFQVVMPDVVDLMWVKRTRQQLAILLSISMDRYGTHGALKQLDREPKLRSQIITSTSNASNAREHLLNSLLIGNKQNFQCIAIPNDPLLNSLLRYREHLDALSGAIWSCQQYTIKALRPEESSIAECRQHAIDWWAQIQELGETCRNIEGNIAQNHFDFLSEEDSDDGLNTDEELENKTASTIAEPENYEDDQQAFNPSKLDIIKQPTKTIIFKGQGTKVDRPRRKDKKGNQSSGGESSHGIKASAAPLPPRDSVSGLLMVQELQKRLSMLQTPEEDDDEPGERIETAAEKAARLSRTPTAPLFLGASGSLLSELKLSIPTAPLEEIGGAILDEEDAQQ